MYLNSKLLYKATINTTLTETTHIIPLVTNWINKLLTIILLHKKVVTTPATIVNKKYINYFLKYSITDLLNTLLYTNLGCNQKGIANVLTVVPKNIPTNP